MKTDRQGRHLPAEQENELTKHLELLFDSSQVNSALWALGWQWDFRKCLPSREIENYLRTGNKKRHKHFARIAEVSFQLNELLGLDTPMWGMIDFDWDVFSKALERLYRSADAQASASKPRKRTGRPPFDWRDDLISLTYSLYPKGKAKKSENSHFEQTVAMLLRFLGEEVEDVHNLVIKALRRQPSPPFTVS